MLKKIKNSIFSLYVFGYSTTQITDIINNCCCCCFVVVVVVVAVVVVVVVVVECALLSFVSKKTVDPQNSGFRRAIWLVLIPVRRNFARTKHYKRSIQRLTISPKNPRNTLLGGSLDVDLIR